jgi:hypothetical protein
MLQDYQKLEGSENLVDIEPGTGSISCNSVFVRYLGRFLNQEELMEPEATVQNP